MCTTGLESLDLWAPLGIGTEAKEQCPCVPGAPAGSMCTAGLESLDLWAPLGIDTEAKERCPCAPGAPAGSGWSAEPTSQCVRKLAWNRSAVGYRSVSFLRCGGIEDAIANQLAHWCDPFRGFPPVIIRPPSKNVGADALIGPSRNAVPVPAKSQLPGNPREVRTTFSLENGCCALREPADIGCLLGNSIQNLPFCQRYAGKTVHLCCRSPHGERGLK